MAEAFIEAPAFVIEQIGVRTLALTGRAAPMRPASWQGTMRAEVTHYPGNPQATVQFIGAQEDSSTFNGKWSDRFLNAEPGTTAQATGGASSFRQGGPSGELAARPRREHDDLDGAISTGLQNLTAQDLAELVDLIRREGKLVKVTWGFVLRVGFLKRFQQKWSNVRELEWEMEFEWISQGEERTALTGGQRPDRTDYAVNLRDGLAVLDDALFESQQDRRGEAKRAVEALRLSRETGFDVGGVGGVFSEEVNAALEQWRTRDSLLGLPIGPEGVLDEVAGLVPDSGVVTTLVTNIQRVRSHLQQKAVDAESAVSGVVQQLTNPVDAARGLVSTATGAMSTLFVLEELCVARPVESLGGFVDEVLGFVQTGIGLAASGAEQFGALQAAFGASAGDVLAFSRVTRGAAAQVAQLRRDQGAAIGTFSRTLEPEVLATHYVREGESIRDVSLRYYGTQDGWMAILRYNRMGPDTRALDDALELPAGTVLFVPRDTEFAFPDRGLGSR